MSESQKKYIGIAVILIALIIRILDGLRVPIYMDEVPLLYNVSHFISHKTLIPEHFSYPTFFSYLMVFPVIGLFLGYYIFTGYPLSGLTDSQWVKFLYDQKLSLFVFGGRFVSLFLSMAAIVLVYLWAKRRYGWGAGLIAALIIGLDPFGGRDVAFSRYALPDVTASFLVMLGMILCFEFFGNNKRIALVAASVITGLAVSTKYNAGMALLPLLAAPFLSSRRNDWKFILSILGTFILGFIIGSPGWLVLPRQFIEGYLFEAKHMATGHLGGYGTDWFWIIDQIWRCDTYVLPVVFWTVGYAIYKRTREDILFLLLIVPSFFYIGQLEKKAMHYFIFLYPVLSLFMGRAVAVIGHKLRNPILRKLFIFLCIGFFFINPLFRISRMVRRDLTLDNRLIAEKWIQKEIPSESTILLDPVIFRNLIDRGHALQMIEKFQSSGSSYLDEIKSYYDNRPLYHIQNIRACWDLPKGILENPADYVVVSSSNYQRFFDPDSSRIPDPKSPLYQEYQNQKAFYEKIFLEENRSLRLLNRFAGIAGPEIRIYQRQMSLSTEEP